MKFLIAIGSKEYSEPTLELGMRVAKAFNAGVTIVYVGEKISAFSTSEVQLAQENLENWELDRQGVDVLEWAYEYLINHAEHSIFNFFICIYCKKNSLVKDYYYLGKHNYYAIFLIFL